MPRALNGIRLVEMTTAVAGPIAGHVLADMGAETIKITEPLAAFGAELNRSKRHLALDVSHPRGLDIVLRLVAISDVLVENFSPRVMGNLGLAYDDLKAVNPSIIAVSMPAFGKSGPYSNRGSYGPGIDAMSGLSHLTGYPDRMPGKPGNYYCDQNAGLLAVFATLAALRHRRRTGEGQYIEMAMLEGELQVVAPALMDAVMNGRSQMRMANRHAWMAPHGVYRCAGDDSWVAIAVATDQQWRELCAAIGRTDLAGETRFATQADRHANQDQIDPVIEAWTGTRDHREVQRLLQAAGVPAGAALTTEELFEDPQIRHRESFAFVDHPESGRFPHTRTAWRSRRGNHGVSGPAPLFGEDNDYCLRELLGLSDADVEQLKANGTVSYEGPTPLHA